MTWKTCRPARPTAGRAPTSTRSGSARTPSASCGRTGTPGRSRPPDLIVMTGAATTLDARGGRHHDKRRRERAVAGGGPRSDDRHRAADRRAAPGLRLPADGAADSAQAVRHVDETVPGPRPLRVEARPAVADR